MTANDPNNNGNYIPPYTTQAGPLATLDPRATPTNDAEIASFNRTYDRTSHSVISHARTDVNSIDLRLSRSTIRKTLGLPETPKD